LSPFVFFSNIYLVVIMQIVGHSHHETNENIKVHEIIVFTHTPCRTFSLSHVSHAPCLTHI